MLYRGLADLVLILHAAFIAFVVVGLVLIWVGYFRRWTWTRSLWFRAAHLLAIGYVVVQSLAGVTCPLTDLENALRTRAGQDPYGDAGFIAFWLHKMIFYAGPSWVFTVVYVLFGLAVLGTMLLAPPRLPPKPPRPADAGTPL